MPTNLTQSIQKELCLFNFKMARQDILDTAGEVSPELRTLAEMYFDAGVAMWSMTIQAWNEALKKECEL